MQVADGRDQLLDLGLGEPAGDLVEQQDGRVAGERAGELETLAIEQRQLARLVVRLVGQTRQLERLDAALVARALAHAASVGRAHEHVLEHAHVRERLGDLERAPDALAAAILPRAGG